MPNAVRKKTPKSPFQAAKAGAAGSAIKTRLESNEPADKFTFVLGPQEQVLHDYLECVFNPSKHQARAPASHGGFELNTELWTTSESHVAVAGANGVALVGVCAANWIESGNNDGTPDPLCAVLGHDTSGAAAFASINPAASYGVLPAAGLDLGPGTTYYAGTNLVSPIDGGMNARTRIRLVAMQLSVRSTLANNTAKGEVMLVGTTNPVGGLYAGSLNNANWDILADTNPGVVTRAVHSLPNWKTDEVFSIVAIPAEEQAFEMCEVPALGCSSVGEVTICPAFNLAMFARGMTPGDSINYDVTYVWESELARTNRAQSSETQVTPIPASTLELARQKSRPYAAASMPGAHLFPFVETLAEVAPGAIHALSKIPSIKKDPLLSAVMPHRPSTSALQVRPKPPSFLDKAMSMVGTASGMLGKTGLLNSIPIVGPAINALANVFGNLFGK